MKKIVKIAVVGLICLIAIGAVALTMDYDSPELGKALLRRASSSDLEITAEGFQLNLLSGLKLEDVQVHSRMPGGSLDATADTVILEHRLGPLLRGEILIATVQPEDESSGSRAAPDKSGLRHSGSRIHPALLFSSGIHARAGEAERPAGAKR
ncbi:MAG: hypothetical protein V3T72_12665 [Thermoanaerobaculia bacterium]